MFSDSNLVADVKMNILKIHKMVIKSSSLLFALLIWRNVLVAETAAISTLDLES